MQIISLQPSVSVILDRLGSLDILAACTTYCLDAVPALRERNLPIVHDSWSTKIEELLPFSPDIRYASADSTRNPPGTALHPEFARWNPEQPYGRPILVIASVPYRVESLTAILKSGHPLLALAPHTLTDVFADIRHIAHIINAGPKGDAVVTQMQAAIEEVRAQAKNIPSRPLVYCEEWGKPLIHSQAWVAELIEIAGGTFLGTPGATTTPEDVAAANPDIILTAWCGAGNRVPLEKIIAQRGWQHLSAVRENRVYCIADELLNTPAPTLVPGLHALAATLHPDVFGAPHAPSVRRIDRNPASSV
jgi:iron complex transport system substrate-binding protein